MEIINVSDISYMFYSCSSLITLPNILKWNPNNSININSIFVDCSSLIDIPDISKWNININKKNDSKPQNQFYQSSYFSSLISKKESSFNSKELISEGNDSSEEINIIQEYIQNEDNFNENLEDYYDNFYE